MLNSAGSKMFNLSIYNVCGKTKGIKLSIFPVSLGCTCGTAKLMEEETRVFTFSMHGATNYPFHKEKSDLDIGLKDGTSGQMYLSILANTLPKIIHDIKTIVEAHCNTFRLAVELFE